MNRKEFLKITGMSAGAFIIATCLSSCKKEGSGGPTNVDFTLDLTQSANSALNSNGGYVYSNEVIVAKTIAGTYIAVAAACTHEGTYVTYDASNDRFHCQSHGSNFHDDGSVQTGPASQSLNKYNTTLSGTSLRVFS